MLDEVLIEDLLCRKFNRSHLSLKVCRCSGGDIHRSYQIDFAESIEGWVSLFVKVNDLAYKTVLESEYTSLRTLHDDKVPDYPKPVLFDTDEQNCYLVMAYHELSGIPENAARQLGTLLAAQHRRTAEKFGWLYDNHIGLTVQKNAQRDNWQQFYRDQRLMPQIILAETNSLDAALVAQLRLIADSLDVYFRDYQPVVSLLHGDLWSGNVALDVGTYRPLLFDPAPYYGDRETDIAMTELFGGFSPGFYYAYNQAWPLDAGYTMRKPLYNLYHALNHFNLFGPGYTNMIVAMESELNRSVK